MLKMVRLCMHQHPGLFGEGEGAIVGAYHDYIVSALGAHDEFVFARHACPSPAQT